MSQRHPSSRNRPSKKQPDKHRPEGSSTTVRLNKLIADSGLCSRREADRLIAGHHVQVNGQIVDALGIQIDPQADHVTVHGKPLPKLQRRYIIFHKPRGYITTRSDEKNRATIYQLLSPSYQNLDPAGRLDRDSSGLLILSNDGDFIHRITHPSFHIPKTYRVSLAEPLSDTQWKKLHQGIALSPENVTGRFEVLTFMEQRPNEYVYEVVLITGYNRQIRRMFEMVGRPVSKLKRIAVGPIRLGGLASGKTRLLSPREKDQLLKLADGANAKIKVKTPPKQTPASPKPPLKKVSHPRSKRSNQ